MNITSKAYSGFKGWHVAIMGSKPTDDMLNTVSHFGRVGKQTLAFAMTLRPEGATDGQQKAACIALYGSSGSHHNFRRDREASREFVRDMGLVKNDGNVTVYKYALGPKGEARIAKLEAVENAAGEPKPVKAKKAGKGKGSKRKPLNEPTVAQMAELAAPAGEAPTEAHTG